MTKPIFTGFGAVRNRTYRGNAQIPPIFTGFGAVR